MGRRGQPPLIHLQLHFRYPKTEEGFSSCSGTPRPLAISAPEAAEATEAGGGSTPAAHFSLSRHQWAAALFLLLQPFLLSGCPSPGPECLCWPEPCSLARTQDGRRPR